MPVVPADPVVTAACFFYCRRAMGAASIRHSLRPLSSKRAVTWHSSGKSCRENAEVRQLGCLKIESENLG
jgi:hypothetical protein